MLDAQQSRTPRPKIANFGCRTPFALDSSVECGDWGGGLDRPTPDRDDSLSAFPSARAGGGGFILCWDFLIRGVVHVYRSPGGD
jgi:hypothetical protein